MKLIEKTLKLEDALREAFKRRRYGPGDYLPDFDLFDAAADQLKHLRYMLGNISKHPSTPELIKQYARGDLHGEVHGWEKVKIPSDEQEETLCVAGGPCFNPECRRLGCAIKRTNEQIGAREDR